MIHIFLSKKGDAGLSYPATFIIHFQVAFRLFSRHEHRVKTSKVCLNKLCAVSIPSNTIKFNYISRWWHFISQLFYKYLFTGNSVSECHMLVNQHSSITVEKGKMLIFPTWGFLPAYLFSMVWGYTEIESGKWLMQLCESPSISPIFPGL